MDENIQAEEFLAVETERVSNPLALPAWLGWALCLASTIVPLVAVLIVRGW